MLVERSMHPRYLSNAYVVADAPGGAAVFVDSGAPLEPLLAAVERWRAEPAAILRTHGHPDHVEHEDELRRRFGIRVEIAATRAGELEIEALPTPGHADDHVAFLVAGACFSGDILFRNAVGGGADVAAIRHSVMDVLMALPRETRVLPGHTDETTIAAEWDQNPFVRLWRGVDRGRGERCRVRGRSATLVVWSPDYDGKGKALVRFDEGTEAIVGGSAVERA